MTRNELLYKNETLYHPTAPRRTASDCFALVNVSSGNGTPTRSKATPPIGNSSKSNSNPVTSQTEYSLKVLFDEDRRVKTVANPPHFFSRLLNFKFFLFSFIKKIENLLSKFFFIHKKIMIICRHF